MKFVTAFPVRRRTHETKLFLLVIYALVNGGGFWRWSPEYLAKYSEFRVAQDRFIVGE